MQVLTDFSRPRTTTRALVDPSRKCGLRCEFCYYLADDDLHTVQPWEQQRQQVLDAVGRGCECCDISGGEPLQNPHVVELVRFCAEQGLPARIISSLICTEKTFDDVLNGGVDDWLISTHGAKAETHDAIVHVPRARQFQIRRMAKIMARMDYCVNYVLVEKNQTEIADWARWLVSLDRKPKIANVINFNVFSSWLKSVEWREKAMANIVDFRIASPILNEAIDILEDAGVGVNCRYTPMCAVAERHRKTICNDLGVWCDFGEWDNAFGARTDPAHVYHTYAIPLSNRNEEKGAPCNGCGHQWICGGANKLWHKFAKEKFGSDPLVQIDLPAGVHHKDFWHYRKFNVMGIDPRRSSLASTDLAMPRG